MAHSRMVMLDNEFYLLDRQLRIPEGNMGEWRGYGVKSKSEMGSSMLPTLAVTDQVPKVYSQTKIHEIKILKLDNQIFHFETVTTMDGIPEITNSSHCCVIG